MPLPKAGREHATLREKFWVWIKTTVAYNGEKQVPADERANGVTVARGSHLAWAASH